ncbi:hypothetical protein ACTFIY_001846 [Dictyostelium cf. discoideum]
MNNNIENEDDIGSLLSIIVNFIILLNELTLCFCFCTSSYSLSLSTKLIYSNQFGLLKEKVYRYCRYLHSNEFSIIQHLKLFQCRHNYYNSSNAVAYSLIGAKNLQLFKLFVNEFNYEPTKTDLYIQLSMDSINLSNIYLRVW